MLPDAGPRSRLGWGRESRLELGVLVQERADLGTLETLAGALRLGSPGELIGPGKRPARRGRG